MYSAARTVIHDLSHVRASRQLLAATAFAALASAAFAQECDWVTDDPCRIWTDAKVGIGVDNWNSGAMLEVHGNGSYPIWAETISSSGWGGLPAVTGNSFNGEGGNPAIGVRGYASGNSAYGVAGYAEGGASSAAGVLGEVLGEVPLGKGVQGRAFGTNVINFGVCGESTSSIGRGVYGLASATKGAAHGVFGECYSTNGHGVFGTCPNIGVFGHAYSATGSGVYGANDNPAGFAGYFAGKGYFGGFLGVGRSTQVTSAEVFGLYKDTTGFGGMYVQTAASGKPFYGYSASGNQDAYHCYSGATNSWTLNVDGTRITVQGSNGNVGIGTTNPAYLLHVNGSAGKPGGGSWSNASDLRLKKDVVQLEGALDELLAVRGVSFEYRDPDAIGELSGRQLGVVAQEVELAFPQWVDDGADGYKRVTFRGFEGVAIEALRELRAEKDAQIAARDARIAGLEERLARLEALASSR